MFAQQIVNDSTQLEEAIDRVLARMTEFEPETKEYSAAADQLTKLYKLKEINTKLQLQEVETLSKQTETELKQEELELRKRVSADTLAIIGGNIAGIVLILGYEHLHVVTSKALGFVMRSAR